MTEEKKEQLIRHLKYDLEIGADYLITDEDAVEIIKALEQQPNADCISRAYVESIVEELENICINGDDYILSLLSRIKNAPPVTPSRPKGHWIEHPHECGDNWQYPKYECSKCHIWVEYDDDFCPGCGADMTEGEEE